MAAVQRLQNTCKEKLRLIFFLFKVVQQWPLVAVVGFPFILVHVIMLKAINQLSFSLHEMTTICHAILSNWQEANYFHVSILSCIGLLPNREIKIHAIKKAAAKSKAIKTCLSFFWRKAETTVIIFAIMTSEIINALSIRIIFFCISK